MQIEIHDLSNKLHIEKDMLFEQLQRVCKGKDELLTQYYDCVTKTLSLLTMNIETAIEKNETAFK